MSSAEKEAFFGRVGLHMLPSTMTFSALEPLVLYLSGSNLNIVALLAWHDSRLVNGRDAVLLVVVVLALEIEADLLPR